MKWLATVFLEEFLLARKNSFLKRYRDKKKMKKALSTIFESIMAKYEMEMYYNDLDVFLSTNKVIQRLAKGCIAMWKENKSYIDTINEIADKFIIRYPQYSPYRTRICNGLIEVYERCFEQINGKIGDENLEKVINQILMKSDKQVEETKGYLHQIIEMLKKSNDSGAKKELSVDNRKKLMEFTIISGMMNRSERDNEVSFVLRKLKENSWLHIWGPVWCGKTQFLKLIASKIAEYKYIDLDRMYDINELYVSMAQLSECNSGKKEYIIDSFLTKHVLNGALFIDGIHEAVLDESLIELISILSVKCRENNIKFITCGYSDVSEVLKNKADIAGLFVYELPGLSEQEVAEIMFKNGMPENKVDSRIVTFLAEVFGSIPALVMELVYELKEKQWEVDDEYYSHLITAKSGGVEKQLEHIIFSRISDENVRRLLYRLAGVGHDIPTNVLLEIGNIEPKIENLDKVRYTIVSRWGNETNGVISLPRVFREVANKYLTESEKRGLHNVFAKYYKEKKVIDEVEVVNFITHLLELQRYDEVGELYVILLASMMDENIKDDKWNFSLFWATTKLPEEMSVSMQAVVRMQQVRYLLFAEKEYTSQLNELLNIVEKAPEYGQILLMLMPLLNINDFESLKKCVEMCSKLELWGKTTEELEEELDSSKEIEWLSTEISLFELIVMKYGMAVSSVQQLEIFVSQFKRMPLEELKKIEENKDRIMVATILEKVRIKLDEEYKDKYRNILLDLQEWTKGNNLQHLHWKVKISYLRYLFETIKCYDEAEDFFVQNRKNVPEELKHEFVDTMSKLLYECSETCMDNNLIKESYNSLPDISRSVFDDIYTCLIYMDISEQQDNFIAAEKMLMYSRQPDEVHWDFAIQQRAKAEYYINAYLSGQLKDVILEFSDFVSGIIESYQMPKRKVILTLLLNDILYIVSDIVNNNPPTVLADGEQYAAPQRGRYWILNNEEKLEELYMEIKDAALLIVLAQLLDFYGYGKEADSFCEKIFCKAGIEKTIIAGWFVINSYLLLKLLTHNQWELICRFVEHLSSECVRDNDISVPIKVLLIVSAYLASISRDGNYSVINLEGIRMLHNLNIRSSWKGYFKEYYKIVKVFVDEDGDEDILLACAERIKGSNIDMLRGVIYVLMYTRTTKEKKGAIEEILTKLSADMKLGLEDDFFYNKLII